MNIFIRKNVLSRCLSALSACLMIAVSSMVSGDTYLVHEGRARAEIVIAETPARIVPIAAAELQDVLERISGVRLPIVTGRSGDGTAAIFVGQSPYTKERGLETADLDHDAYRMASGEDWLALLGRDDDFVLPGPYARHRRDIPRALAQVKELTGLHLSRLPTSRVAWRYYHPELNLYEQDGRGSANAVYAFLRELGFRWYFPGELGQVVPKHSTIVLPDMDRTVHPDFALRRFEQYYHRFGQQQATEGEVKWQLSLGTNMGYEQRGLGTMGHGLSSITTGRYAYRDEEKRAAFHAEHPEEFYALYDGQRDIGGNQCLSSEKLFETAVAYARAMFDLYDMRVLDMSPEDGFSRLCQCDRCEGRDRPGRGRSGRLSDHVWGFINRVAEEVYKTHPDRYISGSVYSAFLLPPEDIAEFSPNVVVKICKWRTWQAADGQYSPQEVRRLRQDWLDILPSGELIRSDYFLHARALPGLPIYYPRLIASDLKALVGICQGEDSEVFRNFHEWDRDWHALATNHLNLYVTARYYWDADLDIDVMLEEYYQKFYGPAAAEMKSFIEFSEENWMRLRGSIEKIDRTLELLETALEVTDPDSIYARRVQMIARYIAPLHQIREQLSRERRDDRSYRALRTGVGDRERMSGKPFDGRIDEKFWPPAVRRARLRDIESGEPPRYEYRTEFQVFREGRNLYLGVFCGDPHMKNLEVATTENNDERIFDGDHVSILIETPTHSYYEIAVNPAGALYEVDHGEEGPNPQWSSGAQVATHRDDYYWSAEIRIPIAGEGARLLDPLDGIDGNRPSNLYPWYFNIGRQRFHDGDVVEWTAFSPTDKPELHVLEQLGHLWGR